MVLKDKIEDLDGEIWKPIPNYECLYEVSNFGRIKSLNYGHLNKIQLLKCYKQLDGYMMITLTKNSSYKRFGVHRLVALAFIENTENKPTVNHINGIKDDNRLENLEWATYSEQMDHYFRILKGICKDTHKDSFNSELYKEYISKRTNEDLTLKILSEEEIKNNDSCEIIDYSIKNKLEEIWVTFNDIPIYKISNYGRVRSFTTKSKTIKDGLLLKVQNKNNALCVTLIDSKEKTSKYYNIKALVNGCFYFNKKHEIIPNINNTFKTTNTVEIIEGEIWKDIQGFEGLYQISSLGRVKALKYKQKNLEKLMNPIMDKYGYYKLNLAKDGKKKTCTIHRLVALHFISNPENKPTVNHKDGNKTNNCVNNLEWFTISEQRLHTFRVLGYKAAKNSLGIFGKNHPSAVKIDQYDKEGNFIKTWGSIVDASRTLKINKGSISRCCRGTLKSVGNFLWKYHR